MVLNCERTVLPSFIQILKKERRRRDLNPRTATNGLLPFQGSPFNHLGTSPSLLQTLDLLPMKLGERREWDSNPCALADKRFSRPPRYDHFDISPCSYLLGAVNIAQKYKSLSPATLTILSKRSLNVNIFFKEFTGKIA